MIPPRVSAVHPADMAGGGAAAHQSHGQQPAPRAHPNLSGRSLTSPSALPQASNAYAGPQQRQAPSQAAQFYNSSFASQNTQVRTLPQPPVHYAQQQQPVRHAATGGPPPTYGAPVAMQPRAPALPRMNTYPIAEPMGGGYPQQPPSTNYVPVPGPPANYGQQGVYNVPSAPSAPHVPGTRAVGRPPGQRPTQHPAQGGHTQGGGAAGGGMLGLAATFGEVVLEGILHSEGGRPSGHTGGHPSGPTGGRPSGHTGGRPQAHSQPQQHRPQHANT
jgi:hypothetical protein